MGAPPILIFLWFCGFISTVGTGRVLAHQNIIPLQAYRSRQKPAVGRQGEGLVGTRVVKSASGGAGGRAWSSRRLWGLACRQGQRGGVACWTPRACHEAQESTGQEAPPTDSGSLRCHGGGRHVGGRGLAPW